tara:strand:- start:32386 stop:32982 length:597 start_codon:yes stop_codon:yes gene_type:complete
MLFGFFAAIILVFLLTAVQNWAGELGLKGNKLAFLLTLWVMARLALFLLPAELFWLAFILEISCMPLAVIALAKAVILTKRWEEFIFLPLLTIMSLINAVSLLALFSRVSLGHTGRTLNPSKWISVAFIATVLSALARVALPYLIPNLPLMAYAISALLGCSAFTVFIMPKCYLQRASKNALVKINYNKVSLIYNKLT